MSERAAQRARIRAQRSRATEILRVRAALDNVGRMLHDDFDAFAAAMQAEFGSELDFDFDDEDVWVDEDEDDEDDEDEDEEDGWDDEEEEDALTELGDDEHDFLSSLWLTERASVSSLLSFRNSLS